MGADNDRRVWLPVFLSVLGGLLLSAGFPGINQPLLAWVAFIPLFAALEGCSAGWSFRLGYLFGLVHYVATLYWIHYVVAHYGGLSTPLAVLILLLLCAYLALYPACFALLIRQWEHRPGLWVWMAPAVWVTLEWLRGHLLTGFPWANVGYTQGPFLYLVQAADITGVAGLSGLVVWANACLASVMRGGRTWAALLLCAGVVAGALFYGQWRLEQLEGVQKKTDGWTVGLVQGNIDQSVKWDPGYQDRTLERYRRLSLEAVRHSPAPELLVWPETAVPFFYGVDKERTRAVQDIARETGVPLLFGSPAVERENDRVLFMNKVYLVSPGGHVLGEYAKQHLVPFGEYVPLRRILFFVHRMVEAVGTFVAGEDGAPLDLDGRSLGALICYEAIFPELSRRTLSLGATVLVNVTNDAWFGDTAAPYQHLEIARWRAVEFRSPLVRAANTGVSAVFEATGRPLGKLPLNEEGYLVRTIHPLSVRTWYARWGDWFSGICGLTTSGGILYLIVTWLRSKRRAGRRLKSRPSAKGGSKLFQKEGNHER